jgi:glyoxylase-like metal-dependent hydrolase (beta-lactamase superfamily II)
MSDAPTYRVLAARYAERETTRSRIYYAWPTYDETDGPARMSYFFWVLQPVGAPPVIVDTGFDTALADQMNRPWTISPEQMLEKLSVDTAQVQDVVVTHLHYDHIGNLHLFPNARFTVAERELDFWASPMATRSQFAAHADPRGVEYLLRARAEGRVRLVDETLDVAPGVTVERVGGHSPGQLIVSVLSERGRVLLASDAAHYYEELELDRPFAVIADLAEAYAAFDVINAACAGGAVFVPAHDPLVMERHPPADPGLSGLVVELG